MDRKFTLSYGLCGGRFNSNRLYSILRLTENWKERAYAQAVPLRAAWRPVLGNTFYRIQDRLFWLTDEADIVSMSKDYFEWNGYDTITPIFAL